MGHFRIRHPAGFAAALLGMLSAFCAGTVRAQSPAKIPPQAEILATLKAGHPRLLVPSGGFAAVKASLVGNPDVTSWAAKAETNARSLLAAAPSRYEIPDGLRLLATSRQVKERVYVLALAYRLGGDTLFAARAWRELEAAAAFPDWNPRHFLDVGEMTHAFAIGYDWLHDWLGPSRRTVVRNAIRAKGLSAADSAYRAKAWWAASRFNWNQVCNGGIAMGALAIAEEDTALAASVLHRALNSVVAAGSMEEFAPDGGWAEGPGYWGYTVEYSTVMLAGLESALGTTFGIKDIPGFSQAGWFPIYTTGPTGRSFNYADGGESSARDAGSYWLARAYDQPIFAWARRNIMGTGFGPKDILWHQAPGAGPRAAAIPLDRHFRHLDLVTARSGWEDPEARFLGFKAGSNLVGHSHLDIGTFILESDGVRWAAELGSDDYNLPGYFSTAAQRWTYYRLRAEGQNTLVLNPGKGPDQDPDAVAAVTRFSAFPDEAAALADLTPAYRGRARSVQRGVALVKERSRFLVQDELAADSALEAWWFMHTRAQVLIAADGLSADLLEGGKRLHARLLSPAGARFSVMDAIPLPTSPAVPAQNANAGWRKLTVKLTGVKEARIAVAFDPLAVGAPAPADKPAVLPLGPAWPSGKTGVISPRKPPRGAAGKAGWNWRGLRHGVDGRRSPPMSDGLP